MSYISKEHELHPGEDAPEMETETVKSTYPINPIDSLYKSHFWHSNKQATALANNNKMPVNKDAFKINYAMIDGETMPYTEKTASSKKDKLYYEDSVYVGEGQYSHSKGVW